ncbi:MAG: hypothetical protein ACRD0Z_11895 [Acidimicrobiales bacterium]
MLGAACGLSSVPQAVTAPLAVLPATDVVVEQNLQSVAESHGSGAVAVVGTVSGPSLNYHEVSESSSSGVLVLAGYNQLSGHCLGILRISAPVQPVLGESQPGTYDFWQLKGAASACDAASFASYAKVPQDWPAGDPTTGGWPGA